MKNFKIIFVLAILLGLLSSVIVYRYVDGLTSKPAEIKTETVVVAATNITQGTKISSNMLRVREVPLGFAHSQSYKSIGSVDGNVAATDLIAGEQILAHHLAAHSFASGLTVNIPDGFRAITIGVNAVVGVGGFIKPGDRVDVIGTFGSRSDDAVSRTILQNVRVLAIDQEMNVQEDTNVMVATNATLALCPEDVERITLAEETGRLKLSLRPPLEPTRDVTGISFKDLVPEFKPASAQEQQYTKSDTSAMSEPAISIQRVEGDSTLPADHDHHESTKHGVASSEEINDIDSKKDPEEKTRSVEIIRGRNKEYTILTVEEEEENIEGGK